VTGTDVAIIIGLFTLIIRWVIGFVVYHKNTRLSTLYRTFLGSAGFIISIELGYKIFALPLTSELGNSKMHIILAVIALLWFSIDNVIRGFTETSQDNIL
jgi:hypothetical protein